MPFLEFPGAVLLVAVLIDVDFFLVICAARGTCVYGIEGWRCLDVCTRSTSSSMYLQYHIWLSILLGIVLLELGPHLHLVYRYVPAPFSAGFQVERSGPVSVCDVFLELAL